MHSSYRSAIALALAAPLSFAAPPQDMSDDEVLKLLNSDANPMRRVSQQFDGGNYMQPLRFLESSREGVLGTILEDAFDQTYALWLSYVGDEKAAAEAYTSGAGFLPQADDDALVRLHDECLPVDAVTAITRLAIGRRAVILNEAHHVPQTRMLTNALLEPLYEQGFRYLALEALQYEQAEPFHAAGHPLQGRGDYVCEPVFADMVRRALELGFTLVPYETRSPGDMNHRDLTQARNIAAVFADDPEARVLVHCGYSHLIERTERGWKHMAECLRELTHLDPLTIDQTRMRGLLDRSLENPYYATVAESIDLPTVFLDDAGAPWVSPDRVGAHDVTVFLPRPAFDGRRPNWLGWYGRRRSVHVDPMQFDAGQAPALLQAFATSELGPSDSERDLAELVPMDQCRVGAADESWELYLPAGQYVLRVLDAEGRVLRTVADGPHVEALANTANER